MQSKSSEINTTASSGETPSAESSGLLDTPVMDEEAIEYSNALSLRSAQPPLQVVGYEQEQFLGRGAFGEVWKAIDSNSGRVVAIKYYNHRGGLDWSHMTREVEKLQYLFSDRHVVQLFDVGWDAEPPYYVMEYMAFGSLEDRLHKGPMSVAEAVKIFREIAVGLAHAHDKGILHCDLKPGNIMLDQDNRPRLADFGQARLKHEHAPALGTLFYMAPEQADLSAAPDARWDVYAMGAMLYRMITGELPYMNDEISERITSQTSLEERLKSYTKLAQLKKKPVAHRQHPGVDDTLAEIIDACLEVDPQQRHPNIQSVLQALDLRERRRSQRPMVLTGILGPSLIVLLMALMGWWMFQRTIATASEQLLERTGESNHFAAQSVAERFSLEVDKRWRILEQEAEQLRVRKWLEDDTADARRELQAWLEQRHAHWNAQFSSGTGAAYWFVLDQQGKVHAISPMAESLIGSYFGYREYFHGQGRELSPYAPAPEPISAPHRSNIFRSQPKNQPAVAFSVPIPGESESSLPLGILAMETEMGQFAEFQGSRNQLSVLVDLRPDQAGRTGLIVEHPSMDQAAERALDPAYLSSDQVDEIRQLCDASESADEQASDGMRGTLREYRDPLSNPAKSAQWLASIVPVRVARGESELLDTGWAIIVQEEVSQTLAPLIRLKRLFLYSGLAALALAALIIGGLWWIVLMVAKTPGRFRSMQFWGRTATLRSQAGVTVHNVSDTSTQTLS